MKKILLTYLVLSSFFLKAQEWELIGPFGGWAQRVEFDPFSTNTVYLGGDFLHGIAKSTNNGTSWNRVDSYGNVDAWNLVLDPKQVDLMYAGAMMTPTNFDPFILKSTDAGITWDTIFKDIHVTDIALDPIDKDIFYLACGQWQDNPSRGYGYGIWKTTDGGQTFNQIGLDTLSVQSLKVNPNNPHVLFAATYDVTSSRPTGIFASLDSGNNWFNAGLAGKQVWKIDIANTADSIIFAACFDSLYRSTDYGSTWQSLNVNANLFWDVSISESNNQIIYTAALGEDSSHPGGLFKSTDGGQTWVKLTNGLESERFWSVSIHPTNPDLVFATTQGDGVWKSTDGGFSWQRADSGYAAHYISTVVPDGNGGILSGMYNEHGNQFSSVLHWDEINGWRNSGYQMDNLVKSIVIDPSNNTHIIISDLNQNFIAPEGGNAYVSTNSATNFTLASGKSSDYFFETITINRANGLHGLGVSSRNLAYTSGNGIYETLDGGITWNSIAFSGIAVTDIFQDHWNDSVFYCTPYLKGFWRSADAGQTWDSLGFGSWPLLFDIEQDHYDSLTFYTSSFENGILKSTDGGLTWNNIGFDSMTVTSILSDPINEGTLYAAGSGQRIPGMGVWKSNDRGNNWNRLGSNLQTYIIEEISIDQTTGYLYASSQGVGVFRYKIFEPSLNTTERDLRAKIKINNPVSDQLLIKSNENFSYSIYNISGKKVLEGKSYNTFAQIESSNWSNGVYIIKISTSSDVFSTKIVKRAIK